MIDEEKNKNHQLMAQVIQPTMDYHNDPFASSKSSKSLFKTDKETSNIFLASGMCSRGSLMLQAALKHRIQHDNNRLPLVEKAQLQQQQPSDQNQLAEPKTPPLNTLKRGQSKSTSKKEVLFADPIVTKQFIYEPTLVSHLTWDTSNKSSSSDSDDFEINIRKILQARKKSRVKHSHKLSSLANHSKKLQKQSDHKADIVSKYLNQTAPNIILSTPPKAPKKRTHQQSDQDSELPEEESLFSSPKIAKVTPYFQDPSDSRSSNLKREQTEMVCQTSEPQPTAEDTSIFANCSDEMDSATEAQDNPDNTPPIDEDVYETPASQLQDITQMDDCSHQEPTYLGWFNSGLKFISDQVNKFIYFWWY